MAAASAGITLYTAGTPNGWKASICLEEVEVPYTVHRINLAAGDQKQDWYTAINPNGRIPAIVDHADGDLPVFESGAVLLHLAERDPQRRLLPRDERQRAEVLSWLFWQVGGLGPMGGQADWFLLFAPEAVPLAIERYVGEVRRLLGVMERRLEGREWLAGGQYSIADVAAFPWVLIHDLWGISLAASYPRLRRWVDAIRARPAVQRGLGVPDPNWVTASTEFWRNSLGKSGARLQEAGQPVEDAEEQHA